ncbi:hypothetical protein [Paenibacillus sp. J2TS4]|nr:hypothetical protein [Paenibacillus sp. J2TS4]GIP34987.1 hypothetical protein J2TS4_41970 [Paenibacillus sp. J2TS4]
MAMEIMLAAMAMDELSGPEYTGIATIKALEAAGIRLPESTSSFIVE